MNAARIYHAATHSHNIGDGAVVAGIHSTLPIDIDRDCKFTAFDILDAKIDHAKAMLTEDDVTHINTNNDFFLVGGGGLIEGGPENTRNGLNYNFDPQLLANIKPPKVLYALGVNAFRNSYFYNLKALKHFLELASDTNTIVTVRDDGSLKRLCALIGEQLCTKCGVQEIPDPGLFVPSGSQPRLEHEPYFILQLAGDRLHNRMQSLSAFHHLLPWRSQRFIRDVAHAAKTVAERHGLKLLLCPHLVTDVALCDAFLRVLPFSFQRRFVRVAPILTGSKQAPTFFDIYRHAEFVIGMRGHSAICAFAHDRPFIGLSTHDKLTGYLKEFGLGEYAIDCPNRHLRHELVQLATAAISQSSIIESRLQEIRAKKRSQLRIFHKAVFTP